jgi:PAS domain S-box-containing protein
MTPKPTYEELERRVRELAEDAARREQPGDALADERRRLLALMDALPAYVYLQAPDHSIAFANRFFRERFGSPDGRPCYEVIQGRKEPCEPCPTFRVLDTGAPQKWEWDHKREGHTYQIYDYPFSDLDGSPLVLELGIDITDRKRAQEALQESEERYRELYAAAPNAYFSVNAIDGRVLMCNRTAERMLGYDEEALKGTPVLDLYADTPEGRPRAQKVFDRFKSGESIRNVELQMKHRDGHPIWVNLSVDPVRDSAGNILESRSMAIDIRERKRAEQEREKLLAELQEALLKVKTLSGMLPICSSCKKIRDDTGYWNQIESYIRDHSEAEFSHGLCPECMKKLYGGDG